MCKTALNKWQTRYDCIEKKKLHLQDCISSVKQVVKSKVAFSRKNSCIVNQLMSGHTRLNAHQSIVNPSVVTSPNCPRCDLPETTHHYVYQCEAIVEARERLLLEVERALLGTTAKTCTRIDLKLLVGRNSDIEPYINDAIIKSFNKFLDETYSH